MPIKDIKNASAVISLINHVKKLPMNISKPVIVLIKERDKEKQLLYLKSLPEETLIYLLKASTYILLSTGVVLKESALEMLLTDEMQSFLTKVRAEIGDAKNVTKEKVSDIVDSLLLTTFQLAGLVGLIIITFTLLLNPATMPFASGILMFSDMILFLIGLTSNSENQQELFWGTGWYWILSKNWQQLLEKAFQLYKENMGKWLKRKEK